MIRNDDIGPAYQIPCLDFPGATKIHLLMEEFQA